MSIVGMEKKFGIFSVRLNEEKFCSFNVRWMRIFTFTTMIDIGWMKMDSIHLSWNGKCGKNYPCEMNGTEKKFSIQFQFQQLNAILRETKKNWIIWNSKNMNEWTLSVTILIKETGKMLTIWKRVPPHLMKVFDGRKKFLGLLWFSCSDYLENIPSPNVTCHRQNWGRGEFKSKVIKIYCDYELSTHLVTDCATLLIFPKFFFSPWNFLLIAFFLDQLFCSSVLG